VRHLAEQGITPDDLHAERATLEDVFLALTNDRPTSTMHTSNTALPAETDPS
jgi:ABC-2 type transport system ATP-binding protein